MARLWQFLTDSRVLGVIGLAALAAFLLLGADTLEVAAIWAGVAALALLAGWGLYWGARYFYRRRSATLLGETVAPASAEAAAQASGSEVAVLRKSMLQAITTIKTSKLGLNSGAAALYELPWYMIIGNPAAGKSSAVGHSGLQFPIAGTKAVQGVAGTRNCDWFFTTDGILLDTAGRYSTVDADRAEWFSFLALLRKYRRRAPINGILICVSVAELMGTNPKKSIDLAKSLRTRVQELTEKLGVYAPVYVVFTKADLIAGFADFFHDTERTERDRVWGATMRFNRRSTSPDVLAFFDQHFDELHDGLKEMSLASMAGNRSARMRPGVFTFPLEFASIKTPLRAFLATLFEENTYQFKPVFRGFYFTSALQEGSVENQSSKRVASRFDLELREQQAGEAEEQSGYFLLDLFRKVIFADKELVTRYTNPNSARFKYGAFFAATILLGCSLGLWSWSYMGNRQLVANVQADLDKVVRLQEKRADLQSRLEALEILQDRIEQLEKYRASKPWMLGFGLYQGEALERKLRDEYFGGVREIMLQPVGAALESLLTEMNANAAQLDPSAPAPAAAAKPGQPYQDASPTNVTDAYNALKTYLMLADKSRAEPSHLNDQLTRFWRGWLEASRGAMPKEKMIRSAERLMSFHLTQIADPAWPQLTPKLGLLDGARENLRRVVRGTPARERVYADIKARAATRFSAVTVARIVGEQDQSLMAGSYAVPGAFTREAWEKFVIGAIREASNKELQSTDWVLKTAVKDDLTLEGSPEQIQKSLTELYKADYTREWLKFVQGVTVADLGNFEGGIQAMNRLGDPQTSPLAKLLNAIYQETSWDNPSAASSSMAKVEKGLFVWFKESILRRAPSEARNIADLPPDAGRTRSEAPVMGPIGREFAGVARLVGLREKQASLMGGYLDNLSRLRGRLNQLKNQGDPGPGAKQFMQQTLEGSGSELSDALKYVDEQMLTGMTDSQKMALRPILVRPLIQTFAVIVMPSEAELNKTWRAQVIDPFQKALAAKAPFVPGAPEASAAEIAQVFGPEGAIAKFVNTSMGPLVVRRGDVLAARTWADIGISLAPQAVASFPGWIAPLSANGVAAAAPQTVFQLLPLQGPGIAEFTVDIDGQQMRYRNTPPAWTNMVYPGPQGVHGARVSAVTVDGRTVELCNDTTDKGLEKMLAAAVRKKKGDRWNELRWNNGAVTVAVELKVVSDPNTASTPASQGFRGLRLPLAIVGRDVAAPGGAIIAAAGNGGAQ
ncbi:type VI secretion system membrane subunit TssM [Massilia eurypsychrophila]|uniref:Type VI secretion system membrane subunit TssM n=1 Tax=Massilia eurypsychrophila TaxID=1485217 RepID=A0A2G8TB86_9BURK|nr:type VI secretion system membrane subunit TssM [Massilia eurypsychrophila]PIL43254.1 type VI secretion system membrane subunit TssM [Massilia eurypsychrophila]